MPELTPIAIPDAIAWLLRDEPAEVSGPLIDLLQCGEIEAGERDGELCFRTTEAGEALIEALMERSGDG